MKITIENYIIKNDPIARYNLYKKAVSKKGNERVNIVGYGMTTEQCIKEMFDDKMRDKNYDMDLQEFLAEYRKISETIKEIANEIG